MMAGFIDDKTGIILVRKSHSTMDFLGVFQGVIVYHPDNPTSMKPPLSVNR
jgi:hypothetical protein